MGSDGSVTPRRRVRRRCGLLAGIAAFLLLTAAPASAQLDGALKVGIGVSTMQPNADELDTRVKVRPSIGRVPSRGWGVALALNWFDAEVAGTVGGVDGRLGTVAIRPLMIGAGYTWIHGRIGISPTLVAGPALNTLSIDERHDPQVEVTGNDFEEHVGTVSFAARPGVSVTCAVLPRLGVTAFGGYLINRPGFTLRTARGEVRTAWSTNGVVLNAGIVLSLF